MRRLLSILGLSLFASGCTAETPSDTLQLIRSADRVLIDVRTPGEYAGGHLEGALAIPHEQIGQRIASVAPDKDRTIVLYCRSGRRSEIARQTLVDLGYRKVINAGGFEQLQADLASSCKAGSC